MKLNQPAAPFERFEFQGDSINIETTGKILVLPTGDAAKLPLYNEYILESGRTLSAGTINFTDDLDLNTGLQNLIYPWIACYDPANTFVDFFLYTHAPKNLICVVESGIITLLILYPGNGLVYHGRITHCNLTSDANNDLVPDAIKNNSANFITQDGDTFTTADSVFFDVPTVDHGSVNKFLESYGMVV